MTKGISRQVLTALAAGALLAGCGSAGSLPMAPATAIGSQSLDARATVTLEKSFRDLHQAIFEKLDANQDGSLDEYEAGPAIDLNDFQAADKNHNHKLSFREFMAFATEGSLFGFMHENKVGFMKKTRSALLTAFNRLDTKHQRLLAESDLNDKALAKLKLNLTIPGLHTHVVLTSEDPDLFQAADHTGDGKLSQAEFEDYCMSAFIKQINPNFHPGHAPTPAPAPADPSAEPSADPSAAPAGNSW